MSVSDDLSRRLAVALASPSAAAELAAALQLSNPKNVIDGGDFTTKINPWQRGTSFTAIANTLTYTADRWFVVGGASSSISVSQQAQTDVPGFGQSLRFGRGGGTDTATINLGQVCETADSIKFQGKQVTLSFWAKAGLQFSAAGGALSVKLAYGTGTDQSAANLVAGSWTNQANAINATATLTPGGVVQRYSFTGTIPATATQIGVLLSYAPTGTNNTTDTVDFYGVQLEEGQVATAFEHMDPEVMLAVCQRFFFQINEPANGNLVASGHNSGTNAQVFVMATPTPMRASPTITVTVGTFKVNSATAGVVAATGLTASGTHTPNQIGLTSTGTGTAGQGATLQGGGGAGSIAASADF